MFSKTFSHVDWHGVLERAGKTFMEAALTCIVAGLGGVELGSEGKGFWLALALSAFAAGVSAVWNGVAEPLIRRIDGENTCNPPKSD